MSGGESINRQRSRNGPAEGHRRPLIRRDARHQPVSLLYVARALPSMMWRNITWRQGSGSPAVLYPRALHAYESERRITIGCAMRSGYRLSGPKVRPSPYITGYPQDISFRQLVSHALGRWMSERDYEELKSELGLSQYEGRNWRGVHHHATLCIAAYAFLMLQRLRGKKTPLRSNNLPYPKTSGRAGLGPMQRHNPVVDRQHPFPSAPRDRADVGSLPLLRETVA